LKATVEPMQIDTGPEDSDANRVMVESTTLVITQLAAASVSFDALIDECVTKFDDCLRTVK